MWIDYNNNVITYVYYYAQLCEENDQQPYWVDEDKVLSLGEAGKGDVFVLEPFEGAVFDHITQQGFKCV